MSGTKQPRLCFMKRTMETKSEHRCAKPISLWLEWILLIQPLESHFYWMTATPLHSGFIPERSCMEKSGFSGEKLGFVVAACYFGAIVQLAKRMFLCRCSKNALSGTVTVSSTLPVALSLLLEWNISVAFPPLPLISCPSRIAIISHRGATSKAWPRRWQSPSLAAASSGLSLYLLLKSPPLDLSSGLGFHPHLRPTVVLFQ